MKVRRVVVAMATGERAGRVIREAVRVASRFGAELDGVFVEDEDLLRLAAHSFARATGGAGATHGIDVASIESEWRAVAFEVRRRLEQEAAARRLRSRFEVRRARMRDALVGHAERGDLVVMGWGGWSPSARQTAPVRVLFDDSDAARRALEAGLDLAADGQLAVWMVGADDARVEAMHEELSGRVARLRVAPIADPSIAAIGHILEARPGGLLLVPIGSAVAEALAAGEDAARFPAGVLVVH